MSPDHDGAQPRLPQDNPYVLNLSNTSIESGIEIVVSLEKLANTSLDFRGFLIWAIDEADDSLVGEFVIDG